MANKDKIETFIDNLEVINVDVPERFRRQPSRLPLKVSVSFELNDIGGRAHTCSHIISATSLAHRYIIWSLDLYTYLEHECLKAGQAILNAKYQVEESVYSRPEEPSLID